MPYDMPYRVDLYLGSYGQRKLSSESHFFKSLDEAKCFVGQLLNKHASDIKIGYFTYQDRCAELLENK